MGGGKGVRGRKGLRLGEGRGKIVRGENCWVGWGTVGEKNVGWFR